MFRHWRSLVLLAAACWPAVAIEQRHGVLVGEILKLDAGAKTVVVKAEDGTEHTLHFVRRTSVHGEESAASGAVAAFHGLKEGGRVAVHYTAKGSVETADEIDNVGKDGLKSAQVTVVHIDRGAKTIAVKGEGGAEETYHLTGSAAKDAGKDISGGAEKTGKVTIYYSEQAGHKVAHFFKRAI
jgi:hypothetical protein